MSRERPDRLQIAQAYAGLLGMERYCREECSRSGPASVWRVYAYLWSREGHVFTSERTIQHGTGLSERVAADAIFALLERGVLKIDG